MKSNGLFFSYQLIPYIRLEKYSLTTIVCYEGGKEAYTEYKKRVRQASVTKRKAEAGPPAAIFLTTGGSFEKTRIQCHNNVFLSPFFFYGCTGNPSTIVPRCGLVLGGTSTVSYI